MSDSAQDFFKKIVPPYIDPILGESDSPNLTKLNDLMQNIRKLETAKPRIRKIILDRISNFTDNLLETEAALRAHTPELTEAILADVAKESDKKDVYDSLNYIMKRHNPKHQYTLKQQEPKQQEKPQQEHPVDFLKKIAEQEGVEVHGNDYGLFRECVQQLEIMEKKPKLAPKLTELVLRNLDKVLEHNPKLQAFAPEFAESLVNHAKKESTKSALSNDLKEITKKYDPQQENFQDILSDLVKLSTDVKFSNDLGPKNSKEFADKIQTFRAEFNQAPTGKTGDVLLKQLESIKSWSQKKETGLKKSVFSKLGSVISSYTSAVISSIKGDSKSAAEHKLNASQAIKELTSGKKMSNSLDKVKTKSSSWVKKIEEERSSKEQNAGKSR